MADARAEANGDNGQSSEDDQPEGTGRTRRRRGRSREGMEEWSGEPVEAEGYLDLREDGYGFLRVNGFLPSRDDVYVPVKFVRQYGLRKGDHLIGAYRPANRSEKIQRCLGSMQSTGPIRPACMNAQISRISHQYFQILD